MACEKLSFSCIADSFDIDSCPACAASETVGEDPLNLPTGVYTQVVITPLVKHADCDIYVEGLVEYFYDGKPLVVVDYSYVPEKGLGVKHFVNEEQLGPYPPMSGLDCVFEQVCANTNAAAQNSKGE